MKSEPNWPLFPLFLTDQPFTCITHGRLLKVNAILKLHVLKIDYKYKSNLLPYYLQSVPFQLNTNSHATRLENTIFQWKPKCV